jgi:prenyltransferase beta subunit
VRGTFSGAAYAMLPGQTPDVWATHFSARTAIELCGDDVPDRGRLLAWLRRLQTTDGGLSWSPEHARTGDADVRASYYGVAAWRALRSVAPVTPPWDVPALVAWLRRQQVAGGGFRFGPEASVPCLWATYRAAGALAMLGAAPSGDCVDWILERFDGSAGFTRWAGYSVPDVWAAFSAVGTLKELGGVPGDVADAVVATLAGMACPGGGYTYREPELAADALRVAAAALSAAPDDPELPGLRRWLEGCQLPNEGGLMYMPGRGAEIRCTLWALAAGAFPDEGHARHAIREWLARLQNPDGGFGYWHGRGSDLVSTASAVEVARLLAGAPALNGDGLAAFVRQCDRSTAEGGFAYGNVPGAAATLRSGLHAARVLAHLGRPDAPAVAALLARHRVRGGGWANQGNRLPDLLSTYEAVATADRFGIPVDGGGVDAFLTRTATPAGGSWSPLDPGDGDPLAGCLHRLLRRRLAGPSFELPALSLS